MVRLLSRLVIVALTASAFSPPTVGTAEPMPGGAFYDDDANVHERAIEAIAIEGITRGCNPPLNNRYCPDSPVSRGEMAAFLNRALLLPDAPSAGFTDVGTGGFAADIDSLAAAGITRGCNPPENSLFCPAQSVTRGQMAAFLARALSLPIAADDRFIDDDGSVFESAIQSLAAAGITLGCDPPENSRFCPSAPVSRAEMATFLARALALETPPVAERPYSINLVGRSAWGADPPQGEFTPHVIDQITIHHSDDTGSNSGPALYRIWQDWHQHLGWPDLAYHFIIGVDGQIYEGRPYSAVGDTATEYDPTGHLLIVVEGDFDDADPTTAQIESLAQMVAWASMYFEVPTVTGHRDHAATTCPGDHLYVHIDNGSLASRVDTIIAEGGVTLVSSTNP